MRVLVGYATAHGSTAKVANAIAGRLAAAGHSVDIGPLERVDAFEVYDALVLGSAIHDGCWLPGAAELLHRHARVLRTRLVWLFSVGSLGETSSAFGPRVARVLSLLRRDSKELIALRGDLHPRGHRHFAGAIERSHWGLSGHLFLKALGGRYGDHRDVEDIDAWADGIARALSAREAVGGKVGVHV